MFSSVLVSHDGSRCVEGTLEWLVPLLGSGHSKVELFARTDAKSTSALNAPEHLKELSDKLTEAGAEVTILPDDYDLVEDTHHRLVLVHNPDLALELLHETSAHIFFTPEGIKPHIPKRILVPLDGTEFSEEILPLLVPLAKAFKSQIELLRVEDDVHDMPGQGTLMARTTDPTHHKLLESLEGAKTFFEEQGIDVITHAGKPGDVSRRILETAREDKADLIAVSAHGYNFFFRWLFGSNADELIKTGTNPILVRNTRDDD